VREAAGLPVWLCYRTLGSPALLILLANSHQAAWAISVRNFERLVFASSAPPSHSVILTRFIAAAVATCCRWVLA